MRVLILTAAAGIAAALVACTTPGTETASSAPPAGRDCFNVASVSGFNADSGNKIRVTTGPSHRYDLDLSGPGCSQIDWAERVGIDSHPSSFICTGSQPGQGRVIFRQFGDTHPTSCWITNVRVAPPEPAQGS